MNTKIFISSVLLIAISATIISCDPNEKQLAKEKARTQATIKTETESLQNEVLALKNELKTVQLKSDLAIAQSKLEAIEKPKEFKTQSEQQIEITELTSKIESIQNEISAIQSAVPAMNTDTTATK
ncbi:MAG: hypothetical protein RJA07_1472 [Bacteroidota bacterium]|jgi:hypothetical protein